MLELSLKYPFYAVLIALLHIVVVCLSYRLYIAVRLKLRVLALKKRGDVWTQIYDMEDWIEDCDALGKKMSVGSGATLVISGLIQFLPPFF